MTRKNKSNSQAGVKAFSMNDSTGTPILNILYLICIGFVFLYYLGRWIYRKTCE